jgi:hypothetical protein
MFEDPEGNGRRVARYTLAIEPTDNVQIYSVHYDKYMKVIGKDCYTND